MSYLGLDIPGGSGISLPPPTTPTAPPLLPPAARALRPDFWSGFARPNIPAGSVAETIVNASKTASGGRKIPWLWIGAGIVGLVVVWRLVRRRRSAEEASHGS